MIEIISVDLKCNKASNIQKNILYEEMIIFAMRLPKIF